MMRFKPPKKGEVQISTQERNRIIFMVKHKMLPLWLTAFVAALKDELKIDNAAVKKVLLRFSNYLRWHEEKVINIYDMRKSVEKDLGEPLDKIVRCE